MQTKIINHFEKYGKRPQHLVTFCRYKQGPFAKNAEAFIKNPIGKVTDWCRKYCDSWFLIVESHQDGDPHVHALCRFSKVLPSAIKFKYARVHIKEECEAIDAPKEIKEDEPQCECKNCIYNKSQPVEDNVTGKAPRKKPCLEPKMKIVPQFTNCTAFYMAKDFHMAVLERYKNYNCSCKLC